MKETKQNPIKKKFKIVTEIQKKKKKSPQHFFRVVQFPLSHCSVLAVVLYPLWSHHKPRLDV